MKITDEKLRNFEELMCEQAHKMGYYLSIVHAGDKSTTEMIFTERETGAKAEAMVIWEKARSLTEAAVDVLVALGTGKLRGLKWVSYNAMFEDYVKRDVEATKTLVKNAMNMAYGRTLKIKNVIFNPPATIVFWEDGTKTVVKDQGEGYDPEKGLVMAITKKAFGNQGNYYNDIREWVDKFEPDEVNIPSIDFGGENFLDSVRKANEAISRLNFTLKRLPDDLVSDPK